MSASPPSTPPPISPSVLPHAEMPEVSMVEAEEVTGVTFTPELWMQRRHWALEVLRREKVRSVLDIGCGTGALLETLVMPPSTVCEPPIKSIPQGVEGQLPSPADSEEEEEAEELFITRLGGLDSNPTTTPTALSILSPPSTSTSASSTASSSSFPPSAPRWEPLTTELWLGNMEAYNSRFEGYECITALEVIEHLEPNILSRFGVVTMGTYRPRLMLVTTPNFDFNSKFPRAEEHGHARKGFVDPTGRTERVFRHSDHKLEMTHKEFVEWATVAAADWGYTVEISGVGISSVPSYYPADHPTSPSRPVFATQTAIFRIGQHGPARSPRSVRTIALPFMPGSSEAAHPHKLAGKFVHPATVGPASSAGSGSASGSASAARAGRESGRLGGSSSGNEGAGRSSPREVREKVRTIMQSWQVGQVSLGELWGDLDLATSCGGSKRWLVGCLGGYGDVPAITSEPASTSAEPSKAAQAGEHEHEFEVRRERGRGLMVVWKGFTGPGRGSGMEVDEKDWGVSSEGTREMSGKVEQREGEKGAKDGGGW